MSKPITRESYILSKVVGNWIGIFVTIVLIQSIIGLLQTLIATGSIPNLIYLLQGMALICLRLFFYVTLMIFLGTITNSRAVILGIILFLVILQLILDNYLHKLAEWLPLILPNKLGALIQTTSLGQTAAFEPAFLPIVSVAALSLIMLALAILMFNRKEF